MYGGEVWIFKTCAAEGLLRVGLNKVDVEPRALARVALHVYDAAVAPDALADAYEAETEALFGVGREERFEEPLLDILVHPHAGILHGYQ